MSFGKFMLVVCALSSAWGIPHPVIAATNEPVRSSSEIRRESNGLWFFIDDRRTPALAGAVYQNTTGATHVREYSNSNSIHALYAALDEESAGGKGHGGRLAEMGMRALRVYELPVAHEEDVNRTKAIFRRLFTKHKIKVLVGDWAGLHSGMDFKNPGDLARLRTHIQKLVATYAEEPWVLGWQLGNENNYHTRTGLLGKEIGLDAAEYYAFMDDLAGMVKEQLVKRRAKHFVSLGQGELTEAEARLIASLKNFDALGINCYREHPDGFEELIAMAGSQVKLPIYFAEIGRPAFNRTTEEQQNQYLQQVCAVIFSHGAGRARSGTVLGAFIHEATDEAWKRYERGNESDAHYGIFDKVAETGLGQFLKQNRDFGAWVLPADDAPDTLVKSAWGCIAGPYADRYGRDYGSSMAYANRAITLYQDAAKTQQAQLLSMQAKPNQAANSNFWALNTVGTAYFILGDCWMLLSYDFRGSQRLTDPWQRALHWADYEQSRLTLPSVEAGIIPTNALACRSYAQKVFAALMTDFPHAQLREANGTYRSLGHAIQVRFPELSPPYLPLTWENGVNFVGISLALILGFAGLSRWQAARRSSVKTEAVMSSSTRFLFFLALVFNLVCLFWLVNWWFHPVRARYYTVQPVLYIALSAIGAIGVLFYFYVWHLLWNMRRPLPVKATPGHRVALVTTRVASEPVESLDATLSKMAAVAYPHDSYLLDEENSNAAKAYCEKWNVIHFSRKGNPRYNESQGRFQTRTKGGNLNSWLYEFGQGYEFVTFLDPDHLPRAEFLDKVLGYFDYPEVAFVQGPQVLHNWSTNWVARGAAEQSYFFYGPIQMGLFGIGACVVNGSHSTFRVSELMELEGDGYAVHDADDILTSMRIHRRKKIGVYVPDVIAEGLAPDTWDEFSKQQRRWAYSMFHLFFHFFIPGLFRMPLRCKLAYLLFALFYFRGVAFAGLLLIPFVSAITGNPPVNANIAGFCLRYLPFFFLHFGILLFLGQRYLIPQGSRRGFWYRAGGLWVAMWWDHLCALGKALGTGRIRDRVVAAKWKSGPASSWRAIRPHLLLLIAGVITFAWACLNPDRRETVWGTLPFLGLIILSQAIIVFKVTTLRSAVPQTTAEPVKPPESSVSTAYSH